jgi:hypothetical protein
MSTQIIKIHSYIGLAYGLWVVCTNLSYLPILFKLNVFSDPALQPNIPGIYSLVESGIAFFVLLISVIEIIRTMTSSVKQVASIQWVVGTIYALFFIAQLVFSIIRTKAREDICNDTSFTGCPVARYESVYTVSSVRNCVFNAYDLNNINNLDIDGGTELIDWSEWSNYDYANVDVLVTAANSNGANGTGIDVDAAAMPLLHDCWYYGCGGICNPRHNLNNVWIRNGYIGIAIYLLMTVLAYTAGSKLSSSSPLGDSSGRSASDAVSREPTSLLKKSRDSPSRRPRVTFRI